jgi:hypothetical protein
MSWRIIWWRIIVLNIVIIRKFSFVCPFLYLPLSLQERKNSKGVYKCFRLGLVANLNNGIVRVS